MFTRSFWTQVFERALKTAAQAFVLTFGVDKFSIANVTSVSVRAYLTVIASAAVLSVLTSIASLPIGQNGSPSLVQVATDPAVTTSAADEDIYTNAGSDPSLDLTAPADVPAPSLTVVDPALPPVPPDNTGP